MSLKIRLNRLYSCSLLYVVTGLCIFGCTSTKSTDSRTGGLSSNPLDYRRDNHNHILEYTEVKASSVTKSIDSLTQLESNPKEDNVDLKMDIQETLMDDNSLASSSPVAKKIVENYLNSKNKNPDGHCLDVSRVRFEKAYRQIYGHLPYQDLPKDMGSKFYTPKQVFYLLYVSASDENQGWKSLPEIYRGKGDAGAITYAGMGTLVDTKGIWGGKLKPGALVQVWRFKEDYEKVVQGTDVKKLDPYGHSFIFIRYVRNEKFEITGLIIADQGFQSYRPLVPRDYEVWWAVNLTV
ncbi:hypothetical protein [Maribacter cobaltidurans]|uniref:Uncharacterized protein n=1 Tax=Maribacter cobaltidurans TaxID=1178778 RepID=A0A223VA81_9FLAO|nr:hypothetical protein [Maribacter cobaltidurans]ASV32236.1 hypothetical protein CJ263_19510 [Maribacter cobaltidurans]GGD90698.1 hypothetical protein GCM10011412_30780 [Maribacter cobaltidurans]